MTSRSALRAAVSARPWVSTKPTTMSIPRPRIASASSSIRYVLPTPAACPRYTFRFPRFGSREASLRNASGSGRSFPALRFTGRLWSRSAEFEIQEQHVHPPFAEDSEKPSFGVLGDERLELSLIHI